MQALVGREQQREALLPLTFFIGNSTYAFSAMLTTFLGGLALGSLLFAGLSDQPRNLVALVGALQSDLAEVHVATRWQLLESFTMRADTLQRC